MIHLRCYRGLRNVAPSLTQRRWKTADHSQHKINLAARSLEQAILQRKEPLAEELFKTGIWKPRAAKKSAGEEEEQALPQPEEEEEASKSKLKKKKPRKQKGDKGRVNIVSEKLCDDIISYMKPSLERHKGCDIIDLYPGAGLWSRKLNELLKPRAHILVEPDKDIYTPFLQPLLVQPGTKIVPKSGIIWSELNSILTPEFLPHQQQYDRNSDATIQRNDTLIVTANIAVHPRKKFQGFESIGQLLQHQFVSAMRTGSLFQKYGRVRMLLWTRPDDKVALIPRAIQRHKRGTSEAALNCEVIREVCGNRGPDTIYVRDSLIDEASALAAARRMRENGTVIPEGRASEEAREAIKHLNKGKVIVPGLTTPVYKRSYEGEIEALEDQDGQDDPECEVDYSQSQKRDTKRLNDLKARRRREDKLADMASAYVRDLEEIVALRRTGKADPDELRAREAEWDKNIMRELVRVRSLFLQERDQLHIFRQDPPLLHWDRRDIEPLMAEPTEFFPNINLCLLDMQPGNIHPLFRQIGPRTNRAGDMFDIIARQLWDSSATPIEQLLDSVWPGARDWIVPRCPSWRDPEQGGVNTNCKAAALTPRVMNSRQWEELLEAWMDWPFRPTLAELVSRNQFETADESGGRTSYDDSM